MKPTRLLHVYYFLNVRYKYRNVLNEYDVADLFEISYQAAKVALDIFDEHMDSGLEDHISMFEHRHMETYMSFLEEMLENSWQNIIT